MSKIVQKCCMVFEIIFLHNFLVLFLNISCIITLRILCTYQIACKKVAWFLNILHNFFENLVYISNSMQQCCMILNMLHNFLLDSCMVSSIMQDSHARILHNFLLSRRSWRDSYQKYESFCMLVCMVFASGLGNFKGKWWMKVSELSKDANIPATMFLGLPESCSTFD